MEWITSPEAWIALLTLTGLEIVLGIDNIIFISILVDRLPDEQQKKGAPDRLGPCNGDAHPTTALTQLGDEAKYSTIWCFESQCVRSRLDPNRWRYVPGLEINPRGPSRFNR